MTIVRILATVFVCGAVLMDHAALGAGGLAAFLADVEKAGQSSSPARADLRIHVKEPATGEHDIDGVAIYRGSDVYLEFAPPAGRVLITTREGAVHITARSGSEPPRPRTPYEPIGATTLIADDFRPFRAAALQTPQIVSETKRDALVSSAPAEASPYVLLVHLLEREKRRPVRIQYYERTINNLVRMRRDDKLKEVGGVWRPGRSEIQDYRSGAVTTIEWRWTTDPELPPGIFDAGAPSPPLLTPPQ